MTATHRESPPRPGTMVILDQLDMLVTGDPVAEIDTALATAAAGLRRARAHGDPDAAGALRRWIDHRLDQRNSLTGSPPAPHHPGRPARRPST